MNFLQSEKWHVPKATANILNGENWPLNQLRSEKTSKYSSWPFLFKMVLVGLASVKMPEVQILKNKKRILPLFTAWLCTKKIQRKLQNNYSTNKWI